jgi:hypothetical protein
MSGAFSTLPNPTDLFVVDGPSATYVNTTGQTVRCDAEPGLYLCLRSDATNNVAYGALVTGGAPGRVPGGPSGELGIPLARIRQCFAAR